MLKFNQSLRTLNQPAMFYNTAGLPSDSWLPAQVAASLDSLDRHRQDFPTSGWLVLMSPSLLVDVPHVCLFQCVCFQLSGVQQSYSFCLMNMSFLIPVLYLSPVKGSRPGKNVQLTENEIRGLCLKSREIFLSQPILLELEAPLKICGES